MPTNRAVTSCNALDAVRGELIQARRSKVPWAQIGESFSGVRIGTLKRIAYDPQYVPKRADICQTLGLPLTAPAPVCPRHGVVHIPRRCPPDNPKPRRPSPRMRRKRLVHDERWRMCQCAMLRRKLR